MQTALSELAAPPVPGGKDASDTDTLFFGFNRPKATDAELGRLRKERTADDLQFLREVIRGDWQIMGNHRFLRSRVRADGTGPWWASSRRRESAAALVRLMEVGTRDNLISLVRAGSGFFVEDLEALRTAMRGLLRPEYLARISGAIEELRTGSRPALL